MTREEATTALAQHGIVNLTTEQSALLDGMFSDGVMDQEEWDRFMNTVIPPTMR